MSNEHTKDPEFDRCAECRMLVKTGEYHPYAACVLYKQLGQADKVTSCLNSVIEYARSRASVVAPQGDALELKKLSSRIGDVIEESLRSYRCQYTRELPDLENGSALVDLLTPELDKDVTRGLQEMELLADYIAADVDDVIKDFAAPVTAPVSTGEQHPPRPRAVFDAGFAAETVPKVERGHCAGCGQQVFIDAPPDGHVVPRHDCGGDERACQARCPVQGVCGPVTKWKDAATSTTPVDGEQEPDIYDAVAEFRDRAGIDQVVANDPALRVAFETQRPKSHAATPPPVTEHEPISEMRQMYEAARRAGLSSVEGRTFEEWERKVSDYGLDDARQALLSERESAPPSTPAAIRAAAREWLRSERAAFYAGVKIQPPSALMPQMQKREDEAVEQLAAVITRNCFPPPSISSAAIKAAAEEIAREFQLEKPGWVTLGRIKIDPETKTETFERTSETATDHVWAILSRWFGKGETDAPLDALSRANKLCRSGIGGATVELIFREIPDAQAVHKWLVTISAAPAAPSPGEPSNPA